MLNPTVGLMKIEAPLVARKAKPGQFIILRTDENGERIPLTVAETDKEQLVTIIFQLVGATTMKLGAMQAGEYLSDFAGPLGRPSELEGLRNVAVIGGGVGSAIAYPVAKGLHDLGAKVTTVAGFRSKDLVILEKEFTAISDELHIMTDDGSYGKKGLVTDALREVIESANAANEPLDEVIAIGPLIMMKFVAKLTKEYGIKTTVSMNPIMVDGTGMCGCCRITVGGETKFACVDGPDFNAFEVDFDEAMSRLGEYKPFEQSARQKFDEHCNLLKQAEKAVG
jgi:ferredoxin--NADP+ reductase